MAALHFSRIHVPLFRFGPLLLAITFIALPGCENAPPPAAAKKPQVVVTEPIMGRIMDYQDFTGRLDAIKMVEIKAHVTGYMTEMNFKEGDQVKEGDVLFQIDPRTYRADLNQTEANLNVAMAERKLMEKNAERAKQQLYKRAISQEDYDTVIASWEKSIANVGAAEAARNKAKLYLDYTRVLWEREDKLGGKEGTRAPLTGRISRRYVDPGNLVLADATVLTTIVTEDPIYAYFDVDERTWLELRAMMNADSPSAAQKRRLPVLVRLANENDFARDRVGTINFIDNRVISTSGTVKMRGVFDNPGGELKPGLFVRVRLPVGTAYDSILIPDEAIQSDQDRKYVWIVNQNNQVEYRAVKVGQTIGELRAIKAAEKGQEGKESLALGERVIVSGMQRVRKGVEVDARAQAPPTSPGSPLVRLLEGGVRD